MRMSQLARPAGAVAAALTLATVAAGGPLGVATAAPPVAGPAAAAASADDATLVKTLDGLLTRASLAGSTTSMQVRDGATGAVVYSRNADQRVMPASNQKLLTSAAAMEVLGPNYRFHTRVVYTGTKTGRTVAGNVYLKGQGDPTLTFGEFDKLATAVANAGITKFTGSLVADDTWFDRTPLGLDWSWNDESYAFAAPISALTVAATGEFDTGSVAVRTGPGATAGTPGKVGLTPPNSNVKVVNRTVTGPATAKDSVTAFREHGTNTVTVVGTVPLRGAVGLDLVSVQSPALLAASVFRDALKRHGVTVVAPAIGVGAAPATAKQVVDRPSMPLSQLLTPFLKLSNNGHAELLTKAMGRARTPNAPGSWDTGLAAAGTALTGLGVDLNVVRMGDGSGVTRRDQLTTRQLTNLLQAAQRRPWFATWYAALPIAGAPGRLVGGTLANRMTGTAAALNLHGKTGTMTGVNALSGYVNDTTGRRLVFSMVSNNAMSDVHLLLDEAAAELAASGSGAGAATARRQVRDAPRVPVRAVTREGSDVECSWVLAC